MKDSKLNTTTINSCIFTKEISGQTYLTDREKSPGDDSETLIRKLPSCLSVRNLSASALVIRPRYLYITVVEEKEKHEIINSNDTFHT